ncbi:Transcriptional regulatory protein LiaR [Bremerella volcania]|uniref:Transcriptional regulatory protein LiaR n=1 Tax=Bremerella volcania TaxID=2527984 RepID=A0A518C9H0_9BACT|nr:response regulator transcription factor [Bremerella volcania]QDU75877.1 Transcriptional regulatory protein LiaR [Bremerella volcania]
MVFDDSEKIYSAICAGANGYLLKGEDIDEIVKSIRCTLIGEASISPSVASKILQSFHQRKTSSDDLDLTPRERDCLHGLVKGKIKREIAEELEVSFSTIDYHVRNIYDKLHVNNRVSLINKVNRRRMFTFTGCRSIKKFGFATKKGHPGMDALLALAPCAMIRKGGQAVRPFTSIQLRGETRSLLR